MTATNLGAVMHSVVWEATTKGPGAVARGGGRSASGPPTDEELRTLARIYWREYVAWGKPRQAIIKGFPQTPRSTANHWIRKAREKYGLPGAHAESEV